MNDLNNQLEIARNILKARIIEKSYKENHEEMFLLASGKKSPYYFDLKQTLLHPDYLKAAARGLMYLMVKSTGKLPKAAGGLTMGADPLVYTISVLSSEFKNTIYPFVIRKQVKDHGSKKRLEGLTSEVSFNDHVVLIDDVITTGKSTIEALDVLLDFGFNPQYAFCILDREEGGRENLKNRGVELVSLFNLSDFRNQ
jgi:orotate phosphoribosyltransferase